MRGQSSDQNDIDDESGLTLKQRAFCDHYLTCLNPRVAYNRAGYSSPDPEQARKDGNALLNQPDVSAWLGQKMKERSERLGVHADRVLLELAVVAYASVADYRINPETQMVDVVPGVPREALGAVRTAKVVRKDTPVKVDGEFRTETTWTMEIGLWDRLKAGELLCRHLGLVNAELPPLEVLFNRLPPTVATILRRLVAQPSQPPVFQGSSSPSVPV
jgi:phage terminase small subunit